MPRKDQPYLPLYVKDWLTNKKLKFCELESHGLMINIMSLMHKEDQYGTIELHPKFKDEDEIEAFASMLEALLPFTKDKIVRPLTELIYEKVLLLKENALICPRMVRDHKLSETRAGSGSEGGKATRNNKENFATAKNTANTEDENVNGNGNGNEIGIDKERMQNFENARKIYPGTKRGFNTEYLNFRKKHKDWRDVVPILEKAIIVQITRRNQRERNNDFVPDWKHFKTWINNRGWEEEIPQAVKTAAAKKRHNSPEVDRMMTENYKDPKYDRNKGNSGDGNNPGRQDPG